ncbi:MAG: hypothetical protein ACE5IY_16505 [bacterium]
MPKIEQPTPDDIYFEALEESLKSYRRHKNHRFKITHAENAKVYLNLIIQTLKRELKLTELLDDDLPI